MYGFSNRELQLPGTQVSLNISKAGPGSLLISWPQTAAGYVLKSSAVLGTGANWQTVSGSPTVVQGNYQLTVPSSKAAEFFKLQK
jgi:hypothetical protein